mgnify:CR=1 FL=1
MQIEKQKTNKLFWVVIIAVLFSVMAVSFELGFLSGLKAVWLYQDGGQKEAEEILVTTPRPNQTVNSPFIVEGKARGGWFFEASFPIDLIDNQGKILGQSYVQAQSDWTTPDFVPFKGEINYAAAATTTGKLILKKDNPSGLPENDKKIDMPVIVSPSK